MVSPDGTIPRSQANGTTPFSLEVAIANMPKTEALFILWCFTISAGVLSRPANGVRHTRRPSRFEWGIAFKSPDSSIQFVILGVKCQNRFVKTSVS